jgi:hypothetical protein
MANVEILLLRKRHGGQTLGNAIVYVEGVMMKQFKTLELPWKDNQRGVSCIPPGRYVMRVRTSERHGRHLELIDVPGRSLILIHTGNYAESINPTTGQSDIKGCILPGVAYADLNGDGIWDITASRRTMNSLMDIINDRDELSIEIITAPTI